VLYNISGGSNLTLFETSEAAEVIRAAADDDAEIIYGTSIDESLGDAVMITLIATGFDERPAFDAFSFGGTSREPQRATEDRYTRSAPSREPEPRGGTGAQPVYPDDDWESESSIIRFLRER